MKRPPRGLRETIRQFIAGTRPIPTGRPAPAPAPTSAVSAPVPPGSSDASRLGAPGDLAAPLSYGPRLPDSDARSDRNILTLHPRAVDGARWWLARCRRAGLPVVIICGTRTFGEQQALYNKGRVSPGPKVTNAKPGQSMHNFGHAWDFGVFDGVGPAGGIGKYHDEHEFYTLAGRIAKDLDLDWGGAWSRFIDRPHIQLPTWTLEQLQREMPAGWIPKL